MIKNTTQTKSGFIRLGMITVICITVGLPAVIKAEGVTKVTHATPISIGTKADIIVKGIVKDKSGPLPGVTVMVKDNPGMGVVTDAEGNYSIKVPDNAVLVFKAIGYKVLEIGVAGKTSIDALLQDDIANLDEVVVVGYGVQKKVDVTGAISSVKGSDLKQSPAANLSNSPKDENG